MRSPITALGSVCCPRYSDVNGSIPTGHRFLVSSSALCLASSVFRTMLSANGGFMEFQEKKSDDTPVEITLNDDNPDALTVVLRIIHHQHDSVKESLPEEDLWEIAILVDKYDLREATKPWINLWAQPYLYSDGLPLPSSVYFNGDRGLFLAYAFWNERIFKSVSKNIILTWRCTSEIPQLHPADSTTANSFQFVPQPIVGMNVILLISVILTYKIVEKIYKTQKRYVEFMLRHIKRYLKRYSGSQVQCASGNQWCDSLILGTITRKLNRYKISTESGTHTQYSITEIRDILVDIKCCPEVIFERTKNHAPCFPMKEFRDMISKIIQKVEGLELASFAPKTRNNCSETTWNNLKHRVPSPEVAGERARKRQELDGAT